MVFLSLATLGTLAVSLGTANLLAYLMLAIVVVLLVSGPVIVYIYYKKHRKEAGVAPATTSSA
jgi:hypothetical protein